MTEMEHPAVLELEQVVKKIPCFRWRADRGQWRQYHGQTG